MECKSEVGGWFVFVIGYKYFVSTYVYLAELILSFIPHVHDVIQSMIYEDVWLNLYV